ncbi:MAG: hypothetical protein ACREAM_13930, partial [Blastocatellia bacterium]
MEGKLSTDNGATWSSTVTLKSGLTGSGGVTDGTAFPENGTHFVGVFYGMTAVSGGTSFGFLRHRNGDSAGVWTDESSALTFFGNERADEWVSVAKADNGRLFVLTRNSNAAASGAVKNTLYKRNPGGAWSKFKVNTSVEWSSPAVGIDDTNDRVYVMGIRTESPNYAEYKICDFGNESELETQSAAVLLNNSGDAFGDLTTPDKSLYSASGLLVCGGNLSSDDVWYRQINFNGSSPPQAGALTDANTTATLAKSNQSKLFYFQSAWWLAALDAGDQDWFLWKFQNGAWSRDLKIETRAAARIDIVLEAANNRLYYVSSHSSATQFGRLLYSNGAWAEEMALVEVANFDDSGNNPVSLARAN